MTTWCVWTRAQPQNLSAVARNVCQIALQSITMNAKECAPRSGDRVKESALRDAFCVMVFVTLNHTLTSISGNVEENASGSTNNVTEPAQVGDTTVETTCASAKMMIPNVDGIQANTTEIVTAPVSQIGPLVTVPASPDTTSATTPTATHTQMAPSTPRAMICVHQQATFQNTSNTAAPVTSACLQESSVPLTRAAPVQRRPQVRSPSS